VAPETTGGCAPPTVQVANSSTCHDCEQLNCPDVSGGCNGLTGTDQTKCLTALSCIRSSSCMLTPPQGVFACFCGAGVDATTCQQPGFVPTGVCAAEITAGFSPGTTNQQIYQGMIQGLNPATRATALSYCDYNFCGTPENFGGNECVAYCH
jgi:hypothetical protein